MNVYNSQETGLTNNYLTSRHYNSYFTTGFKDFPTTDDRGGQYNYSRNIVKNIHENNPITDVFFSQKNIDYLQAMMIKEVFRYSGYRIGRQSDNELLIIMRSLYLQYSDGDMQNFQKTVNFLNQQVLFDAVPRVITRVSQYVDYSRDAGVGRTFFDRPENVSITGTKTNAGYDKVNI